MIDNNNLTTKMKLTLKTQSEFMMKVNVFTVKLVLINQLRMCLYDKYIMWISFIKSIHNNKFIDVRFYYVTQ